MHMSTTSAVEKSLRSGEKPRSADATSSLPFMNCSRLYADQSFAAGSVISYRRICMKSPCSGAAADSTV